MEQRSQKGLLTIIGILVLVILVLIYSSYIKSKENITPTRNLSAAVQSSTASVVVGNATPTASSVSLHGGTPITINASPATTSVTVTGVVSDANSCNDIASINIAVYKAGTTCTAGTANNNNCYFTNIASSSADVTNCSAGFSDVNSDVSHTFTFDYYADPGTWYADITPIDIDSASTTVTSLATLVNETLALEVTPTLNYGAIAGGANSIGDNTITSTNLGNVAIDFNLKGANLICTGTNSQGLIPVGNLKYALGSFIYGASTSTALSALDVPVNADLATTSGSVISDLTYWQVTVPSGVRGICSGAITFTAIPAI